VYSTVKLGRELIVPYSLDQKSTPFSPVGLKIQPRLSDGLADQAIRLAVTSMAWAPVEEPLALSTNAPYSSACTPASPPNVL